MFDVKRKRARQQLDSRLASKARGNLTKTLAMPPKGYIRAIRDALGMTAAQLGKRLGILPQGVLGLEKSEQQGTITLKKLKQAAEAMGCQVVYAIIPKDSLDGIVQARAQAIAVKAMTEVRHTMVLEDQEPESLNYNDRLRYDIEITTYIVENISESDLWGSKI